MNKQESYYMNLYDDRDYSKDPTEAEKEEYELILNEEKK